MIKTTARERVALIFCKRAEERFFVEFVSDNPGGLRQWRFPVTEQPSHDGDGHESPAIAARRLAREDFGHDVNPMQCYGLHDYRHEDVCYRPFLVYLGDAEELRLPPGGIAEWKTFPALVILAGKSLFPEAHLVLLNAADEHLQECDEDDDEVYDETSFIEDE